MYSEDNSIGVTTLKLVKQGNVFVLSSEGIDSLNEAADAYIAPGNESLIYTSVKPELFNIKGGPLDGRTFILNPQSADAEQSHFELVETPSPDIVRCNSNTILNDIVKIDKESSRVLIEPSPSPKILSLSYSKDNDFDSSSDSHEERDDSNDEENNGSLSADDTNDDEQYFNNKLQFESSDDEESDGNASADNSSIDKDGNYNSTRDGTNEKPVLSSSPSRQPSSFFYSSSAPAELISFPNKKPPSPNKANNERNEITIPETPETAIRIEECLRRLGQNDAVVLILPEHQINITNFYDGNPLHDHLKEKTKNSANYSPARILTLMRSVIAAVKFFHDKKIIHGDLKPKNIIISKDELKAKIIDFEGTVTLPWDQETSEKCILITTTHYLAPECFKEMDENNASENTVNGEAQKDDSSEITANFAIDRFSLGVILLNILGYGYDHVGTNESILNRNRNRCFNKDGVQDKARTFNPEAFKNNTYTTTYTEDMADNDLKKDLDTLADTFSSFGPEAGPLLQNLIDHLLDIDPTVRPTCEVALQEIDRIIAFHDDYLQSQHPTIGSPK